MSASMNRKSRILLGLGAVSFLLGSSYFLPREFLSPHVAAFFSGMGVGFWLALPFTWRG